LRGGEKGNQEGVERYDGFCRGQPEGKVGAGAGRTCSNRFADGGGGKTTKIKGREDGGQQILSTGNSALVQKAEDIPL